MIYTLDNVIKSRAQGAGYSLHIRHLRVASGEQVALTGPSGCGKSTALDILGMLLQPDNADTFCFAPNATGGAGETGNTGDTHEETDVAALWQHRRLDDMAALRLRHMGYVLQTGGLLPYLTVAQNMALSARMQGRSPDVVEDSVRQLAHSLGIEALLHSLPATLSVGERQRAAIGRALAPHPQVVLADEPTAALDPVHAAKVMDLFRHAVQTLRATLVMVTHDVHLARSGGLREVCVSVEAVDEHGGGEGGVRAIIDDESTFTQTLREGHAPCATSSS